jgi:recombinational DNA repair ATPase RecF
MFFGLKNSPATFQNMMNYEYRDTIDFWNARGTAIRIYMDDIAIATSTNLEDHIKQYQRYLKSQNDWIYISNQRNAPSMPHVWITWG